MKPNKFTIKDVVNDIYSPDLTKYNRNEWQKVMEGFFDQLRIELENPETKEIKLLRFATFRPKQAPAIRELARAAESYELGIINDDQAQIIARKVLNLLLYAKSKGIPVRTFEELFPEIDRRFGKADWWAHLRDAIREAVGKSKVDSRSTPDDDDWDGSDIDGE